MAIDANRLPSFDQLPAVVSLPGGVASAWGVFGNDDEFGTWNLATPAKAAEAAKLVRTGRVFSLNLPLNEPDPPLFHFRKPLRVSMFDCSDGRRLAYDEHLDDFCPQASSQWDGHRHVCNPVDGFYNGRKHDEVLAEGSAVLGIQNLARRGVATRGVLLDVARYLERQGTSIAPHSSTTIDAATLRACAAAEGVEIRAGDVLLFHTGWLAWMRGLARAEREALAADLIAPGLLPGREMAAYLWDLHIAAIATDTIAVEAWPVLPERGFFHFQLITYFGMNLGEMWDLDALAADCAADGVYEFMLTSAPLNIPGGVGSPPNALAIK